MRASAIFFVLMLLGILVVAGAPARADDAIDVVQRAMRLASSGDLDTARTLIAGLDAAGRQEPLVISAQGVLALLNGNTDAAETTFRAALAKDDEHLPALWGVGLCLLRRSRVYEAATYIDHAAALAPTDTRIKTLQAYTYCQLNRVTDAARAGKAALDGGERSPFLLATLAVIQRRMGYAQKALEFGSFAARSYSGMDFLAPATANTLPLTMTILDTPDAPATPAEVKTPAPRAVIDFALPKAADGPARPLQIVAPPGDAVLRGMQRVQVAYRGKEQVRFIVFQVDGALRGMITELPYHFNWDADAVLAGKHELTVRAYDGRGALLQQDTLVVQSSGGTPPPARPAGARAEEAAAALVAQSLPLPTPLSLYVQLGWWYKEVGEAAQALAAFEKAAAIDPNSAGVLAALGGLYHDTGLHPLSLTGEVRRGPAGHKRVALTFDDGPNPIYTPDVMQTLARYEGHATFFLVGKMAQQHPDIVLQLLAEGHEIANHTYTHPNITRLTNTELIAEVLRARVQFKDLTGRQTYLFRPPGGNIDEECTRQLRALDFNIIYWDVNAGEFNKLSPDRQIARMLERITDGSVVLMHSGLYDNTPTILPGLLAALHARGYAFVTVTDLMNMR